MYETANNFHTEKVSLMESKVLKPDEKLQILIAEDEKNIGDLLVELLQSEDREITVVNNGLEAIKKLKERPYDLLITDLMMPEVDGMEVIHRAKKLYPDILVIIITGYASLETAIQAVKEGAYDYLRKPFRLDELKISVDNACERIYLIRENKLLLEEIKKAKAGEEVEKQGANLASSGQGTALPTLYGLDWIPPDSYKVPSITPSAALTELERLGKLLQQGLISEDEFQTLKKKLIGAL
ncbi:MAG TPA: response regulator [Dissulfuribacter thermophilus]|uniref:Response regulator n=1 Tax=Dissulfuribacter thermophilus TaxID=1156395 RepID=A0A7V2SXR0_9BACT|nr:response regulator [Dissulfuribacter thermophilus]